MAPSFFISLLLLSLMSFFQFSSTQLLCHEFERLALEQFKNSFLIDKHAFGNSMAYPKTDLWQSQGSDCCSWKGITCSQHTGHVVGIELNNSCLFGSINSTNALFRLAHLRYLNLADNHFNYSSIPPAFGNLSRLISLDLSNSVFSGQVPFEISKLSKLTKLDLSWNVDYSTNQGFLSLKTQDFKSLIQNLTRLEFLRLSFVNINSSIPYGLANLSSLTYLSLRECGVFGEFPNAIFQLPKLETLSVSYNSGLTGILPEFQSISPLKQLDVSKTSFSGEFPKSLELLSSLEYLTVANCNFSGIFPPSLSNLTKLRAISLGNNCFEGSMFPFFPNLTQLEYVDLSFNRFTFSEVPSLARSTNLRVLDLSDNQITGPFPQSLGLLSSLEYLTVANCNFSGIFPPSLSNLTKLHTINLRNNSFEGSMVSFFPNLTQLDYVDLSSNHFTYTQIPTLARSTNLRFLDLSNNQINGPLPSWLTNLTQLTHLSFERNMIQGTLPSSISRLKNLQVFDVGSNKLTGTVELETFLGLQHLKYFSLSGNSFSLVTKNTSNHIRTPKFFYLQLGSCNLKEFPAFLQNQDQLQVLDLHNNTIHGQIPKWLLKSSVNLLHLYLVHNSLTSFEESYITFPPSLLHLDLRSNFFKGSLPIPPPSIVYYAVASNSFDGEIPLEFCNLTSLQVLDLSSNNLSGIIPQCLGNSTRSLSLGQNNLWGKLPRSLAECKDLELIDVSDNQIRDTFPSWLGVLPHLKIIILRSNGFYGEINDSNFESLFPELRVVDLSHNELVGPLPLKYFQRWNVMGADIDGKKKATYMDTTFREKSSPFSFVFTYSMTITNKGNQMEYEKILEIFTTIDLSCNKFSGGIPEIVGNLRKLKLLNLSNNVLVAPIPSALGNLSNLEALDLSNNKLNGRIPTELTQITSLEVFDVSNNLLTGAIPRGRQFDTFENSSFKGNPGLCGMPLSKKCGNHAPPLPSSSEENGHISLLSEIGWRAVLIGCVCGFLGGVVLGVKVFARKQEWLMETFRIKQGRRRSGVRRR